MGGTHYFVLRQGDGWIFVTGYCRVLHTSGVAMLGHTGARALALEAVPTSGGKHANYRRIVDRELGAKWS